MNKPIAIPLKIALVFVLTLMAGCPKPWCLILINNTGRDLTLRLGDSEIDWGHSGSVRLERELGQLHWVASDRATGTVPVLQVADAGFVRDYKLDIFPVPAEFIAPGSPVVYTFQLEPDGNLYIVRAKVDERPARIEPQPLRLPIRP